MAYSAKSSENTAIFTEFAGMFEGIVQAYDPVFRMALVGRPAPLNLRDIY